LVLLEKIAVIRNRLFTACLLFGLVMAAASTVAASPSTQAVPVQPAKRPSLVETTFKSVDAHVSAQWEFPEKTPAPLVVIVPASDGVDRHGLPAGFGDDPDIGIYHQLSKRLVEAGFAVFRYDQPGTGRSGRGQFATSRSTALEGYRRAVDHARVDPKRVFMFGHSGGTDTAVGIFSRYNQINPLTGMILLANQVAEGDILTVKSPALIIVTDQNPDDQYQFGEFPTQARARQTPPLPTKLVTIKGADHSLLSTIETDTRTYYAIEPDAISAMIQWLRQQVRAGST
jgi:pimeloyl-ACP methyl ester carboxylesterase